MKIQSSRRLPNGPCRTEKKPEQERTDIAGQVKQFDEALKKYLSPDIRLLKPVVLEYSEDFWFSPDQLVINHSVPGVKMAGYDKPDLPYHLRHFVESGWGTKAMIDFTQLEEKTVTLSRFDPLGTKLYLAKGEVVGCSGFNKGTLIGCSLAAHIKVPDARECMRKLSEFGSHLTMVYGDYSEGIQGLADMLDLEVVHAT